MAVLRVLLVGAGHRGHTWADVCSETPGIELVGIVDPNTARATQVHPVVHDDLRSAAHETVPDAVIVATPADTHHAVVSAALSEGKHVLCEKPLAIDYDDMVDLVAQAEERDLHLIVGMNFRYLATSQRIRRYVQHGELGRLNYAQFSYVRHRDGHRADLGADPLTMPHPMLIEQSIHHFDLLRYCYGMEVESLVADSWRPPWSTYAGDCCVSVLFRFANDVHVNYLGTWTSAWNKMSFRWRSDFELGALVQREQFDDVIRVDFEPELGLSGPRFKGAEEAEAGRIEELPPCRPFVDDSRLLLQEFVEAIRQEREPVTTGRDHLRSFGLVQACIESSRTGSRVVPE